MGRVFDVYRLQVQDARTTEPQSWLKVLGIDCSATKKSDKI